VNNVLTEVISTHERAFGSFTKLAGFVSLNFTFKINFLSICFGTKKKNLYKTEKNVFLKCIMKRRFGRCCCCCCCSVDDVLGSGVQVDEDHDAKEDNPEGWKCHCEHFFLKN